MRCGPVASEDEAARRGTAALAAGCAGAAAGAYDDAAESDSPIRAGPLESASDRIYTAHSTASRTSCLSGPSQLGGFVPVRRRLNHGELPSSSSSVQLGLRAVGKVLIAAPAPTRRHEARRCVQMLKGVEAVREAVVDYGHQAIQRTVAHAQVVVVGEFWRQNLRTRQKWSTSPLPELHIQHF